MSHLAWITSLPKPWKVKPLKAVADCVVSSVDKLCIDSEEPVRLCNYTNVYHNEFITLSMEFMKATATRTELATYCLRLGDVIITKDSETWEDIGVPALVIETADDLVCGYHLALIRPNSKIVGAFLLRCLQAKLIATQLELVANGVTRFGLPKSGISSVMLPVPPLPDQQAIANYLDRETARIDALVAAKKRLVDLLAEKRSAFITYAVIRGLDSSVSLHDSGIPWLSMIPTHWEVQKVAWLFRERDERGRSDLPLLEVSIDSGVSLREFSTSKIESTAADFNTYKIAKRDDIVFNKMRMWQGAVGAAPRPGLVSPDYVVAEPISSMLSSYAALLFRTAAFSAECGRRSYGIVWDRLRLYWDGFRDIELPLPPAPEQSIIVKEVAQELERIDLLQTAAERTIDLLKERRAALITAAVTGQIDVKEMTA